mmetsp:Transcript_90497/g.156865  ORF Transcript_90497/g.156865 Transcript_90497/m.156865 type:complete len:257 (-) Transcript_90497:351-1121(-)
MSFSESPLHLDTTVDAEMLKKVVSHSVATALARSVLPVPGGPKSKTPFHGASRPVKNCGYFKGITTASFSNLLAWSRPTMLFQDTPGLRVKMSREIAIARSRYSLSAPKLGSALSTRFSKGSSATASLAGSSLLSFPSFASDLLPCPALDTRCPTSPPSNAGASDVGGGGVLSGAGARGGLSLTLLSSRGLRVSLRARRRLPWGGPPLAGALSLPSHPSPSAPLGILGSLRSCASFSPEFPSAFRVSFGLRPKRIS